MEKSSYVDRPATEARLSGTLKEVLKVRYSKNDLLKVVLDFNFVILLGK